MKLCFMFLITLLLASYSLKAQDVIIKTSGEEIEAKITEIGTEAIRYKKFNNLDGPVYVINKNEVFLIKYSNGEKEVYTNVQNTAIEKQVTEPIYNKPDEPDKEAIRKQTNYFRNRQNLYFSLALGYGNSYGGVGIRAQGRFGGTVGFGIHGGIGYFPQLGGFILTSGGVKFFPYKWIYFDAQFGSFGAQKTYYYYNYYYDDSDAVILYGPSFLTGVDMIFGKHFGFNAALGVSYDIGEADQGLLPAVDIGFHFKF